MMQSLQNKCYPATRKEINVRKLSRPETEWISGGLTDPKWGLCEHANEKNRAP